MLSSVFSRLVAWCVRWRWLVLVVSLLLSACAVTFAAKTLVMNTDTDALFDANIPFRVADEAYNKQFPEDIDLIVVVIDGPSKLAAVQAADKLAAELSLRANLFRSVRAPEGSDFFAHNGFLYLSLSELEDLSARLSQAQPMLGAVTSDRSARGLFSMLGLAFTAAAEGEEAAVGLAPAVGQAADVVNDVVEGKNRALNWSVLLGGLAPGGEQARAFVLTQPRLDTESLRQGGEASAFIRDVAKKNGLTPENGYRVRLTGDVPLSDEEFASLEEGSGVSGLTAVVLVTVLLIAAVGSLPIVGAVVVTLIIGFLLTVGWAAASVGEINLISVAFAIMFLGIAVDFAIQFCLRYRDERRGHVDVAGALRSTGGLMTNALLLAAVTTALGFFSFLPTAYRGVAQLGVIAGGGMLIAVLLTFTVLPALLSLVRGKPPAQPVGYTWAAPFNHWLLRRRKLVLGVSAGLCVLSLAVLPRLNFDFDPLRLKDPNSESMSTILELMDDPWSTPNTLNVLAKTPDDARALANKLGNLPEVRQVMTVFDFVPDDQQQKLGVLDDMALWLGPALDVQSTAPVPTDDEIAASAQDARNRAQIFLDKDAGKPETAVLREAAKRFIAAVDRLLADPDHSKRAALSPALTSGLDSVLKPLRDGLNAQYVSIDALPPDVKTSWIAQDGRYRIQVFPSGNVRDVATLKKFLTAVRTLAPDASGPPAIIYETGRLVTNAFAVAAALALTSITLLLFIVLRRVADVARVLAPLLLAAVLTLGTCAAFNFPLTFANIIALPLLLGIGVAFPIYLVTAWREGDGLLLTSPAGRGMLYSALTTASAFGSLALSSHPGTAGMGILLTMALVYTLLTTLLMLPSLLGEAPKRAK